MSQPLSRIIVHLIFSTKDRVPVLSKRIRTDLFPYLATVAGEAGGQCYTVGGGADHVHIALLVPTTATLGELVHALKEASSRWLKGKLPVLRSFAWQRGYGAFSVSPQKLDALISYIAKQEEYHQTHSFQEEYRGFLRKAAIAFDEASVWE